MVQSPEYPDLRWMPPRSWTNANRDTVQLIVIHTTEGSAHGESAEDGAAYDQRRTDGTSTHYFHDSDSTVQCVRTEDQAHTARTQGNRRGIHHELCGRAGWSAADWRTPYAAAMLRRAAHQAARDARKWNVPVTLVSYLGARGGARGFCGHHTITAAFPQDRGTHTDPGPNFPWARFLDMVRDEMEDDMTPDQCRDIVRDELTRARDGYAKAVGDLEVDIRTDTPGVDLQPWSRVDAYARDERAAILKSVSELRKATDLAFDAILARLPEVPPGR